jgi:hypothetical protein
MELSSMIRSTRFPVLLGVVLCCTSPALLAKEKLVELTVVGSGSDFKLQFLNSQCSDKNAENGCIEAVKGDASMLNWELDSIGETYWMLTRLQFSADGENWGDSNFPLKDCTVNDFELEARDRMTGNAASAMITGNGRMIRIPNRNTEACQTWYRIYAMPKAGGMEIYSDAKPLITNQGGATP